MFDTVFAWNKKLTRIREAMDKQIAMAPRVKNIYLQPKDYRALVDAVSKEWLKWHPVARDGLRYRGYEIKPYY